MIAHLLLIAVAVSVSVLIFMWSQGFLGQTSGSTGAQQSAQNQVAQSSIEIETIVLTTGVSGSNGANTPVISVLLRNVGSVSVTLGSSSIAGRSSNSEFTGNLLTSSLRASGTVSSSDGSWTYTLSPTTIKGGLRRSWPYPRGQPALRCPRLRSSPAT